MGECNQPPSYNKKIPRKEIRSIIFANFKAEVSEKELFKKNRGLSPSTVCRHYSNLKSEKEK